MVYGAIVAYYNYKNFVVHNVYIYFNKYQIQQLKSGRLLFICFIFHSLIFITLLALVMSSYLLKFIALFLITLRWRYNCIELFCVGV